MPLDGWRNGGSTRNGRVHGNMQRIFAYWNMQRVHGNMQRTKEYMETLVCTGWYVHRCVYTIVKTHQIEHKICEFYSM